MGKGAAMMRAIGLVGFGRELKKNAGAWHLEAGWSASDLKVAYSELTVLLIEAQFVISTSTLCRCRLIVSRRVFGLLISLLSPINLDKIFLALMRWLDEGVVSLVLSTSVYGRYWRYFVAINRA